jgi:hypothetical protein
MNRETCCLLVSGTRFNESKWLLVTVRSLRRWGTYVRRRAFDGFLSCILGSGTGSHFCDVTASSAYRDGPYAALEATSWLVGAVGTGVGELLVLRTGTPQARKGSLGDPRFEACVNKGHHVDAKSLSYFLSLPWVPLETWRGVRDVGVEG